MKIKIELKAVYDKVFYVILNKHMISFDLYYPFEPWIDNISCECHENCRGEHIDEPKQIRTFFRRIKK